MFYWNLLYYLYKNISKEDKKECFNPCFIGTYSITENYRQLDNKCNKVLILVLLELTLLHKLTIIEYIIKIFVLILVLLELTLLRIRDFEYMKKDNNVLILVLLELTLLHENTKI